MERRRLTGLLLEKVTEQAERAEETSIFERRVSAYQVGVTGDVILDGAF